MMPRRFERAETEPLPVVFTRETVEGALYPLTTSAVAAGFGLAAAARFIGGTRQR